MKSEASGFVSCYNVGHTEIRIFDKNYDFMGLSQVLLLVLVGFVAGIVSGSLGVGGGIILIPALVYLFGMDQHHLPGFWQHWLIKNMVSSIGNMPLLLP